MTVNPRYTHENFSMDENKPGITEKAVTKQANYTTFPDKDIFDLDIVVTTQTNPPEFNATGSGQYSICGTCTCTCGGGCTGTHCSNTDCCRR